MTARTADGPPLTADELTWAAAKGKRNSNAKARNPILMIAVTVAESEAKRRKVFSQWNLFFLKMLSAKLECRQLRPANVIGLSGFGWDSGNSKLRKLFLFTRSSLRT
jgi:hypothetical protein